MTTIIFMVSVALILSVTFVTCYFWNLASGQYDDLVTPALRVLFDDTELKVNEGNVDEDGNRNNKITK